MKKQWFLIRGVEYSTDFKFFLENQILTSKSSETFGQLKFCSRLESFVFGFIDVKFENDEIEIKSMCRSIHTKLLSGVFGEGVLVDDDLPRTLKCMECMWVGGQEELVDNGCPICKTDHYLESI